MRVNDEEWIPTHIKLRDGREITASPLLDRARQAYKTTRSTYSLNRSSRKMMPTQHFGTAKGRLPKYSYEDSVWMQDKPNYEIAAKFNITAAKANAVKHYVRKFWNL